MYKKLLFIMIISFVFFNISYGEEYITIDSLLPLLQKSPLYNIYKIQYENSLNNYYLSQVNLKPNITFQASYNQGETKTTIGSSTTINTTQNTILSLSYSQIILPFGEAGINVKTAELSLEQAKNNFKINYNDLYLQFLQSLYNLYLAQEKLKIYEESYSLAVKQRETAEKQFENKVINEINLLDYKQKEKLAEINYNSAKSNLELAYKSLENLLGITLPRIPVKIDIKYDEIKDKPEDLLNKLYANNLSIKNASLDLEKSKLNLDKAYLPSWGITFSGSYNTGNTSYNAYFNTKNYLLSFNTDQTFGDTISSNKESWSIKVQFSIPILDGGSSNINKTQAELSLKQMQINFEKTKKDVELNFWKTYYNLIQAQATIKQKEITLEQKKMNFDAQKIRFGLGLITELDLKSYEIEYMQAKYDLEDAILNYNLLRVQLNNLIGS